jgi:serine/threonine-protein kinase
VGHARTKIVAPVGSGSRLGKFVITRSIGRGGMCEVFEARHEELNKLVAVKVLKPEYTIDPIIVDRFLREGRAASRVRHRHAIDMLDVGTHDGVVYLAMEYLAGEDLSVRLKREGALPVEVAVDLVLPVLAAIVEAHDCGVVHRDLKPANIFLASNRRGQVEPKVLDFGISKVADDAQMQTATETLLGTPAFMAPEQIRSARSSSPASDQYSLGVILYQCVTGRLPFKGENPFATFELVVKGEYPRAAAVNPGVPAALDQVIARAMARAPAAR